MLALNAPLNQMSLTDCIQALEHDDCDQQTARDVAWVLRGLLAKEINKDSGTTPKERRTIVSYEWSGN